MGDASSAQARQASSRGIIVCADDFAYNLSVSLAIAKLARLGRLSATSAMVLSPRWAQDASQLQDLRGRIDVGLHLDWTSTFALDAGHGMSLGAAMRRAMLGGFERAKAAVEIERQLDLFEQVWQAPPDHVDGHQHVHQFAGICEALVDVLTKRYGARPVLPYLRISRAPVALTDLKSRVIAWMGANDLESRAISSNIPRAGALFGIYNFEGNGQRYSELMRHWLARASPGAILMCHPAQAAEPDDGIGIARAQEFAYFCGDDFDKALAQSGWHVSRGCDLLGLACQAASVETPKTG
jgi:predicted glycoside hydrolase/deacetylase ChbG (UPF0249 family)